MSNQIKRALEDRDMRPVVVAYQPKVEISQYQKKIIGYEALLRWRGLDDKVINPEVVIKSAAEFGRDYEDMLFQMIVERVCLDITSIPADQRLPVAINCSPHQVGAAMADVVQSALKLHDIKPGMIEIEITEHIPIGDLREMPGRIKVLRDANIPVWLDDFGAGYSCLANLVTIPATGVKMDRSFIRNGKAVGGEEVVDYTIKICNFLKMKVILEGIETELDHQFALKVNACLAQGYFYGRPLESLGDIQKKEPASVLV